MERVRKDSPCIFIAECNDISLSILSCWSELINAKANEQEDGFHNGSARIVGNTRASTRQITITL